MGTLAFTGNTTGMAKVVSRLRKPKFRRWFLKEWRQYRGYTQEQLADMVGMSVSNISQMERGAQGYSSEGLAALAEALRCEPGHLLMVDPTQQDAIWSLWETANEAQREQIVAVSKAIVRRAS
jgi:transcriptional regulator with XRE-family HTH domain